MRHWIAQLWADSLALLRWALSFVFDIDARKRDYDIQFLWPSMYAQAVDIEQARSAFATHALHDPTWTDHFTRDEILAQIKAFQEPETRSDC